MAFRIAFRGSGGRSGNRSYHDGNGTVSEHAFNLRKTDREGRPVPHDTDQ
jgi:hypothetical protein